MYTPFYKTWWFVVGALVIGSWLLWFGYRLYDDWKFGAEGRNKYTQAMAEIAAYEAEELALKARYAVDFDGGKTPEETWNLFVDALKRGDTDEAAKYYVVEKQEEMKKNFEAGTRSGAVNSFLNDVLLIKGGTMYPSGDRFEYYTDDIDGGPGFVYMLVKNPITGVWKIEDL